MFQIFLERFLSSLKFKNGQFSFYIRILEQSVENKNSSLITIKMPFNLLNLKKLLHSTFTLYHLILYKMLLKFKFKKYISEKSFREIYRKLIKSKKKSNQNLERKAIETKRIKKRMKPKRIRKILDDKRKIILSSKL